MRNQDTHLITLGQTVRWLCEQRGMSLSRLAETSGIDMDALEAGTVDPTYCQLMALGDSLGVPLSTLVEQANSYRAVLSPAFQASGS